MPEHLLIVVRRNGNISKFYCFTFLHVRCWNNKQNDLEGKTWNALTKGTFFLTFFVSVNQHFYFSAALSSGSCPNAQLHLFTFCCLGWARCRAFYLHTFSRRPPVHLSDSKTWNIMLHIIKDCLFSPCNTFMINLALLPHKHRFTLKASTLSSFRLSAEFFCKDKTFSFGKTSNALSE